MGKTTAQPQIRYFGKAPDELDIERRPDGTALVRGFRIFKVGSFADSKGRRSTWTAAHLAEMVYNFRQLRSSGIFPDVPVRVDHSESADKVVGYFADMRADDQFLYADLEITEPDAADKIERKTYRGRSAEIGLYESNDEELFWPVTRGVAFVDLPAVEGLYSKNRGEIPDVIDEEIQVHTFTINGQKTDDPAVVEAYIATVEAKLAAAPTETATFRVNGADESDFAKVQTHIAALEAARDEAGKLARADFVKQMIDTKKIPASAKDATEKLVDSLSDEQFAAYREATEAMPQHNLFAIHGADHRGDDNPDGSNDTIEQIDVDRGVVANHRRAGLSDEKVKETPAYKRLAAAGEAPF
jgi:hypothetical protein